MISGIIAWVRKKIALLKTYIWNTTLITTVDSTTGGGHKLPMRGPLYWIHLGYSQNKVILTGAVTNAVSSTEDFINWDLKLYDHNGYYKLPLYGAGKFIVFEDETGGTLQYIKVLYDGSSEWVLHEVNLATAGDSFGCAIYAGGQFIVVLESNTYFTSTNGLTWVQRVLPTGSKWSSILYRNGQYLICASNWYNILTSTDGITWTIGTVPTPLTSIGYVSGTVSNTGYVLMSHYQPRVIVSPDGFTWTTHALPALPLETYYEKVVYGAGIYLLLLNKGTTYYTSTDGITWISRTIPFSLIYLGYSSNGNQDLVFANNRFILVGFTAVSPQGVVGFSDDGINWYHETQLKPPYLDFCYGNGKFVAASYERIWSTTDLAGNWDNHYVPYIQTPRVVDRVASNGSLFVSVSFTGNASFTSTDGITWLDHALPTTSTWSCFKYMNGLFVLIGGLKSLISTDGIAWTEGIMPAGVNWVDVEYGNGFFIAVSDTYVDAAQPYVYGYSTDGLSWTLNTLPLPSATSIAFGNGEFKVVGGDSDAVITTADAVTWTSTQLPSVTAAFWRFIVYGNNFFIAFSADSNSIAVFRDQVWVLHENIDSYGIKALAVGTSFYMLNAQGGVTKLDFTEVIPPSPPVFTGSSPFNAELTSNATVNTYDIPVTLTAGQVLKFGTVALSGASTADDTFIRLVDPDGIEVASNDDYDTLASYIEYTALSSGAYVMKIGCYGDTVCTGTVAWEVFN